MEQKATVEFDAQDGTLTISGELLPHSEGVHDMLVDFLAGEHGMRHALDFDMTRNVVTYSVKVSRHDGSPSAQDLEITELKAEIAKRDKEIEELKAEIN